MIDFMGNFKKVNHNLIPLAGENHFCLIYQKMIRYWFLFYFILQNITSFEIRKCWRSRNVRKFWKILEHQARDSGAVLKRNIVTPIYQHLIINYLI